MKNRLKIHYLILPLSLYVLTACSRGGDGGSLNGDAGNPTNNTEKLLQDIENPISSVACTNTFAFVQDWGEELMNTIRSGDAACVKKVIETSKIDVNEPQKVFAQDKKSYPLWHALTTSALFFANGTADQAFQVVKVLVEAGAKLDIKNDSNQSPLQYSVENDEVFKRYPVVAAYLITTGKTNLLETNNLGLAPYDYLMQRGSIEHLQLMLVILTADYEKAKAASDTEKSTLLLERIKDATAEVENLKTQLIEIPKMINTIESIGG